LEPNSPNREENRAVRPTVLGSRLLGKLAASVGLIVGIAGCQLGTRQPLNLPPGLGSPHSSSFKPDTGQTNSSLPGAPASLANGATRVRGQTPDQFNNGTFGNSETARKQNQPSGAYAPPSNNRYSGQSTLAPNSGMQRAPQTGLVSAPSGTQPPTYVAQQGNVGQQGYAGQPTGQPSNLPNPYQQPALEPSYQSGYQQPVVPQPAPFDPYATTQANPPHQNNFAGTQAGVPNTYQLPGQYGAGQPNAGQYTAGQYTAGQYGYDTTLAPGAAGYPTSTENALAPGAFPNPNDPNSVIATQPFTPYQPRERIAPLDVYLQEARTGRVMIGGSVNSDLGLSGQLTIDERNFDITKLPTSWDDVWSGRAFRGRGQSFRAELMPGTRVQRYTVNWSERNFLDTPYSLSVGGFLYTRQFNDWTEQRLGGRAAVGYEITKDLSISTELRMEDVKIFDPIKLGVPQLDRALGSNDLYTGRIRLAHDTRDSPFMSSEGHLLEMIYDQVFGEYDYPRGLINYNRYFLVRERPDQTGRHTLASTWKFGFSGSDTPIFENFYAGGYSTLRGFRFRGASPKVDDVQVGGRFMFLGSLEYVFPLTADEMLRGVAFCDYGTIEQDFTIKGENFRVAPGLGLRVAVPALGPAPLAFDFAYPVQKADGDETQVFSFFMGFTR
jgi:outer membrane protein insertion porin family